VLTSMRGATASRPILPNLLLKCTSPP
jgi:hypothetical protein